MQNPDIAIVGGGLAGSIAAAMLGRAGFKTVLIDPNAAYPVDFRAEKLSGDNQLARFRRTGLADAILPATTHDGENWIARFGYLLDKSPSRQHGIMYDDLVNAIRAQIPPQVETVKAKVTAIATSDERQTVTLSAGEPISPRLVILANGLNVGLRHSLGIARQITSACHSISLGFDMIPTGRAAFDFRAMTYFSERPSDLAPYLTMFPIGDTMRANLFVYRPADDPWLKRMRNAPVATLNETYPRLQRLTGEFDIQGPIKVRPVDLYVSTNYVQAGVVLVGDAFQTACPVTGTGTDKVFTDVAQLCNIYIPRWLATGGMSAAKIAEYYADPEKRACDAWSDAKAYSFRSVSIDPGLFWSSQRIVRAAAWLMRGALRWLTKSLHADAPPPPAPRVDGSAQRSRA